jgi:hypothetical protein
MRPRVDKARKLTAQSCRRSRNTHPGPEAAVIRAGPVCNTTLQAFPSTFPVDRPIIGGTAGTTGRIESRKEVVDRPVPTHVTPELSPSSFVCFSFRAVSLYWRAVVCFLGRSLEGALPLHRHVLPAIAIAEMLCSV